MKEFEKKANPPRDSEGVKGLSKFLPMTESAYRRRLTEYEIQIQDLQAHARAMETEVVASPEEARGDSQGLRRPGEQAAGGEPAAGPGLQPEREAREHALRGARADLLAEGGGRQALRAALQLRRVPLAERRRHGEHPVERAQGQGEPPSVDREGIDQARAGARPQRGPERHRDGGLRDPGRGRHHEGDPGRGARGRHGAGGRGEGRGHRGAAPPGEAQGRRPPPHGLEVGLPPGEAAEERGRGPGSRGGPGHPVRGHRRPHDPDRGDPGRGGAAVPLRRLLPRAQAARRPRASSSTGRPGAARR